MSVSAVGGKDRPTFLIFVLLHPVLRNMIYIMIKTFADKELEKLFNRNRSKSPEKLQRRLRVMLGYMEDAVDLDDLAAIPGGRLEPLKGRRKNQYGLQVSGNWRLCFVWEDGYIYDLELVDYH